MQFKIAPLIALSLLLTGFGCSPTTQEAANTIDTQSEAEAIADSILPADEWRVVSKWLQLDNGNVWLLTRQTVSKGEPAEINPCGAKNNCPVESWIVNPDEKIAHLISSQNEYLSRISVTAEPIDDEYLKIDWKILAGDVSTKNLDRTEYVSQEDGSLRP